MNKTPRTRELPTGDHYILAYLQHMAATAQSEPAKRVFELFQEHEKRRLTASGAFQLHKTDAQDSAAANQAPRMDGSSPTPSINAKEGSGSTTAVGVNEIWL